MNFIQRHYSVDLAEKSPIQGALRRHRLLIWLGGGAVELVALGVAVFLGTGAKPVRNEAPIAGDRALYTPTAAQSAGLTVKPVVAHAFRSEVITDGKIAVNEDRTTPIFSPYSGRVTKLAVRAGDTVERGQLLFVIEATDMVAGQNDFMTAASALKKARALRNLAEIVEKRQRELYEGKAVALKDWQQAQADLAATHSDVQSAEIMFEASRRRLQILGKTDEEIAEFDTKGTINPDVSIYAPIAGTVI